LARGDDGGAAGGGVGGFVVRPRQADGIEAAHHVLAPKQFDLQSQNRDILSLQARLQTSAHVQSETFRPTEIDELLSNYQDRTAWKKLVYSSWDRSETDVQTMHQRWAADDWLNAKQHFMESLGHRTQRWNRDALVGGGSGLAGVPPPAPGNKDNREKKWMGQKMSNLAQRHASTVRLAAFARGPTALARDLAANISQSIEERWALQQDTNDDDMNLQELVFYKDVVKMMSEIVGENSDSALCPPGGAYSSICFREDSVGAVQMRRARGRLTLGAKRHLEQQKFEEWSAEVDEAVNKGRLRVAEAGPSESRQQRIRSFVGFNFHMGNIVVPSDAAFSPKNAAVSEVGEVKVPVWAYVYHCLRVGELAGAVAEISRCRAAGHRIDEKVLVCLETALLVAEPDGPELTALQRHALFDAMYRCQVLFQEEYDKPADRPQDAHSRDPFKALVLSMLSIKCDQDVMSELLGDVLGANNQIEDFLWGSLWSVAWAGVAQLEDAAQGRGGATQNIQNGIGNLRSIGFASTLFSISIPSSAHISLCPPPSLHTLHYREEALYQTIASLGGADYFNESNCFVYCKVLLCCQKYGEAVLFLWRQRKAFAAVHLAVVCLHYGLVRPHRPLTYAPATAGGRFGAGAQSQFGLNDPSPAALLRIYTAAPFLLDYPEEAADYLKALDSKWPVGVPGIPDSVLNAERLLFEAAKAAELTTLLTTAGRPQLTKLVGALETTGRAGQGQGRTVGYLDQHMRQEEVNHLLAKAAHFLLTQARDSMGAVYAFQLAGRYEDALDEMVNQLGLVLVPSGGTRERELWVQHCTVFHEKMLGGRLSLAPVLHRINARVWPSRIDGLAATLETMIHLVSFVDLWYQARYKEALSILDALDFRFDERLIGAFADMHRAVQQAMDFVLLKAMDCCRNLFLASKGKSAAEDEYRRRAADIAKFSAAVSWALQPTTASTVGRIEVGLL
jgi:hypothetical protein